MRTPHLSASSSICAAVLHANHLRDSLGHLHALLIAARNAAGRRQPLEQLILRHPLVAVPLDDVTNLVPQHPRQLPFGFKLAVQRGGNENLPSRQSERVSRFLDRRAV